MKYKFGTAQEMLDTVQCGNDLFCPKDGLYVFEYNDEGAICSYRTSLWEAMKIQDLAKEGGDYWGAFLGPGGSIYDDPSHDGFNPEYDTSNLGFCEEHFESEWVDCEDIPPMQE